MTLKVVILAAGKGTRMRSDTPKVLQTIGPCSLLEHVIRVSRQLGDEPAIVVYGHGGEQVTEALAHLPVQWVLQQQQLGTGHAVQQALPHLDDADRVLVLYGDVPLVTADTLQAVIDADGLGLLTVLLDDPDGYGRIVRQDGQVQRIVEHKDADDAERGIKEINTGILAASGGHLRDWLGRLNSDNAQGEFYLTDIIAMAVADGVTVTGVTAANPTEVQGINDRQQQAELERAYQLREARRLMAEGVCLRDPARFDLRGELQCGRDVTIDINVIIEGRVELGDRVSIGPNVLLKDVTIGNDVTIHANSVLEQSRLGSEAVVGPFARLRPDTVLADKVKVGNFVEIKKSTIGTGSKVNHLSYIGDTRMGAAVNIGAGTITCNYDGANKHLTVIGDNVFVGSDSQLIAPVTIETGATIGAGSTITRNADAGKLTLSRSKQVTTTAWTRPVKKK